MLHHNKKRGLIMDKNGNSNKGRTSYYQVVIKHRGEFTDLYLEALHDELWEYLGDVAREDIIIRKKDVRVLNGY